MAKSNTFHCSVITPERAVLDCDASFVAFPAHDGEIGILPRRAPLLFKLGIGKLRVESAGDTHAMAVDGGFAQMLDNRLTILTEQATAPAEIDAAAAEQALADARAMKIPNEDAYLARDKAIRRAKVQLGMAKAQSG